MKRRVFLGLPVILGILFYIWYIFHASDNVAYSDYIRLINSYLPDVTNPAKFFVPDILTRVPITYLGRIINVKLFGYNTYFEMILGVLSWVRARRCWRSTQSGTARSAIFPSC